MRPMIQLTLANDGLSTWIAPEHIAGLVPSEDGGSHVFMVGIGAPVVVVEEPWRVRELRDEAASIGH